MDTELLGIKFDLIQYLGEKGFNWFSDFGDIEADMSNAEIKITMIGEPEGFVAACGEFSKDFLVIFVTGTGYVKLRRKGFEAPKWSDDMKFEF